MIKKFLFCLIICLSLTSCNSQETKEQNQVLFCMAYFYNPPETHLNFKNENCYDITIYYDYYGIFIDSDGNIRKFIFEQLEPSVYTHENRLKLLNLLEDVSDFEIIGDINFEQLNEWIDIISRINIESDLDERYSYESIAIGYTEVFGVRFNNDILETILIDGYGNIFVINKDENAILLVEEMADFIKQNQIVLNDMRKEHIERSST